jgi:hypothetical protein
MVRTICTAIALLSFALMAWGNKEIKYPVSDIPDSLKVNAKAVIRNHEQVFEIRSIGKGIEKTTYAVTILNENGLEYAIFRQGYDRLSRLSGIKGTVYNAMGEKVEQLTNEKIMDYSAISGFSLFEDNRVKYFEPKTMSYPFTVEYSYTKEYDGLLSYPAWDPIPDFNVSLQTSGFRVVCPDTITFRYKEKNLRDKNEITRAGFVSTYAWRMQNLTAIEREPFSSSAYDYFPSVILAPDKFEIEGYTGNCSTWEAFGKWSLDLLKDRDNLNDETKQIVQQLVKNHTSDVDKAKAIYEYMQNRTRYVSIQEGLGGWQPFEAETVNRLGYGDCKALSNYMKALLSVAGIKSYYTRISAGKYPGPFFSDFPCSQFNHVILCVPIARDTFWLECTDQHLPFGYIGSFTDDRDALVITETGGKLIHTRAYSSTENRLIRSATLILDASGNAELMTNASHSGVLYDDRLPFYLAGTEDKKKMILDDISLPGAELKKFDYRELRAVVPSIAENLEIAVPRYATLAGSRMLVPLIPLDRLRDVPRKVNNRKSDVVIRRNVSSCDTITVVIPENFTAESVPSEIKAESRFGAYSLHSFVNGNKVVCIRKMEMKKGLHSPSTYTELIDFFKKVAAADNTKISLKKAGGG